ncbi:MAG: hypothetical protein IPN32_36420 [Deltaproteobacteria bacterium]|nr:hypothetical protein [Deltaproteobacteria bacterium]
MRSTVTASICLALCLSPIACGESSDDNGAGGAGGKGDNLTDKGICAGAVIDKRTGDDGTELADLSELADVFAQKVLQAEGDEGTCPTTYGEIMAKLRETDKENCEGVRDGLRTAVVSETAQVMGKADTYRTVTTRQCGDREPHELLFSLFGLRSTTKGLPGNVEVIAFDRTNAVFNYYAIEDGEMHFFGNSADYMKIAQGEGARCNECHPNGALNMKELAAPWVHWEGDTTTPGADTLVDGHDDLGSKTDGIELEGIVDRGNDAILATRTKTLLATNDLKQVLRPLFCAEQLNLEEGSSSAGGGAPSSIPGGALVDSRLSFGSVSVGADVYTAAIKAAKQKVVDGSGAQLKDKSGKGVVDTHFAFVFPVVSREDQSYVDKLVELKVIDEDFKNDVLAVDMTRPVFSADRCRLLESAPSIAKLTTSTGKAVKSLPKKIRDGFVAALAGATEGSAEAQLAGFLANTSDADAHVKAADDFFAACEARPKAEFMADALKVVSLRRNQARELPVMEFAPTMPMDSLQVGDDAHLDAATCTLVE